MGRILDSYANPRLRNCLEFSQIPFTPLASSDYVNKLSSYFKHSWLASRPVDRFLCGSGATDCLGPSLTKLTILGGSGDGGGGGGHAPPGNFEQLCCFSVPFQSPYIENQIEYDIIFQGLHPMCSMIFLKPLFLQARK